MSQGNRKLLSHVLLNQQGVAVDLPVTNAGDTVDEVRLGSIENSPLAFAFYDVPAAQVVTDVTVPTWFAPLTETPDLHAEDDLDLPRDLFKSVQIFRLDGDTFDGSVPVALYGR